MEKLFPWESHPAKQIKGGGGSQGSGLWFRACGRRTVSGGQKGLNLWR